MNDAVIPGLALIGGTLFGFVSLVVAIRVALRRTESPGRVSRRALTDHEAQWEREWTS
jgi:hypothetical protein